MRQSFPVILLLLASGIWLLLEFKQRQNPRWLDAAALVWGAGIYVSAIGAAFSLLLPAAYFGLRWRRFFAQFLTPPRHGRVSWKHEIWPFQWRIAVSWMSGYFIFDLINPVAFYFCGPVDALAQA